MQHAFDLDLTLLNDDNQGSHPLCSQDGEIICEEQGKGALFSIAGVLGGERTAHLPSPRDMARVQRPLARPITMSRAPHCHLMISFRALTGSGCPNNTRYILILTTASTTIRRRIRPSESCSRSVATAFSNVHAHASCLTHDPVFAQSASNL
ncbi:unnamed protein product [Mycena citricolor]|uniref:Uncharacterized protein n=1 Tax=Mycena citricolor TaxID=2018698 RepID=A0AAD2HWA4_9AGAR|nr:unnamed protein product [Mycena citricolor]